MRNALEARGLPCRGTATLFIVVVAVHLVGTFVLAGGARPAGDSAEYLRLADNLLAGNGFSLEDGAPYAPTTYRTPGYPIALLIMSFGRTLGPWSIALVQALAAAGAASLLWVVLSGSGVRFAVAWTASLAGGVYPSVVQLSGVLLPDSLSTSLCYLVLAFWWCLRRRTPGGSGGMVVGLGAGAVALLRPEFLLLAPILAGADLLGRDVVRSRLRRSALLMIGAAIPVLGWGVHNQLRTGDFVVTADIWSRLPEGYFEWVLSWTDHPRDIQGAWWDIGVFGSRDPALLPEHAFDSAEERRRVEVLLETTHGPLLNTETDTTFAALAARRKADSPIQTRLIVPLRRIWYSWLYAPTARTFSERSVRADGIGLRFLVYAVASLASVGLLLVGAASVPVALARGHALMLALAGIFLLRCLVVGWLMLPEPRYVVQAIPGCFALLALLLQGSIGVVSSPEGPRTEALLSAEEP